MKMNKIAQSHTMLNWVFYRIPIIVIVFVFYLMVLRSPFVYDLETHEVENSIFIKRLTYSPNLLAYKDQTTKRVYPGIIDLEKFDTEKIKENLINNNNRFAAYLELINLENGEEYQAYVNEKRARAWDDYVFVEDFDSSLLRRYVKIYDNGEFYQGILKVKVLVRL